MNTIINFWIVGTVSLALGIAACGGTATEVEQPTTRYTLTISEVVVTPTDDACPDPQWLGHGGPSGLDWVWSCAIAPGIEQCNQHYTDCLKSSDGLDKSQCSQVPSIDNVFKCECLSASNEATTCTFRAAK